jgi:hypothetical protein
MTDQTAGVPFLDLNAIHAALKPELDEAIGQVVATGAFIGGSHVERFEQEFADYCDASHCVGVANGTDALELILLALGAGPGTEVIVPANTFVATVAAVVTCGATPRFVDVSPHTLLMEADAVAAAITPATVAVVAVHLYGQMADVAALSALADRHGIALVRTLPRRTAPGSTAGGRVRRVVPRPSASTPARTSAPSATEVPSSPVTRRWPQPSGPSPTTAGIPRTATGTCAAAATAASTACKRRRSA